MLIYIAFKMATKEKLKKRVDSEVPSASHLQNINSPVN